MTEKKPAPAEVDPDREVKDAMNEINKQKRERLATEERAEAEKMLTVLRGHGGGRCLSPVL